MKVRDAAEAIEEVNDSRLGLSGSVWTRDRNKATALARKMNTGMVNINNVIAGAFQFPLPFAGWQPIRGRLPLRRGLRHPQILPHQKHCRRTGCDEERAALVSLQRQEGQAPGSHGPDDVGQRLGGEDSDGSSGLQPPGRGGVQVTPDAVTCQAVVALCDRFDDPQVSVSHVDQVAAGRGSAAGCLPSAGGRARQGSAGTTRARRCRPASPARVE